MENMKTWIFNAILYQKKLCKVLLRIRSYFNSFLNFLVWVSAMQNVDCLRKRIASRCNIKRAPSRGGGYPPSCSPLLLHVFLQKKCVYHFNSDPKIENNQFSKPLTLIFHIGFNGTVVNRALSSFHRGSLELERLQHFKKVKPAHVIKTFYTKMKNERLRLKIGLDFGQVYNKKS